MSGHQVNPLVDRGVKLGDDVLRAAKMELALELSMEGDKEKKKFHEEFGTAWTNLHGSSVLPGLDGCKSPNPSSLKDGCMAAGPSIGIDQYGLWCALKRTAEGLAVAIGAVTVADPYAIPVAISIAALLLLHSILLQDPLCRSNIHLHCARLL